MIAIRLIKKISAKIFLVIILYTLPLFINAQTVYPRITAYVGIMHPVVTISKNKPVYNFDNLYIGGLPVGLNIWKNATIGFSFEFVPFIRVADGTSKMSNFLFHPGVLFALGKGYTLATRAAFETSGRYGVTPVLNKVIIKNKASSFYVAIPVPVRFGNDMPFSISPGFQFGIAF